MMDFTLSNCKDLDVRKVTCGITKRFAILLVMMVMITSKALAGASFEVIDGFKYILDSDTKTGTLMPNTEPYVGDKIVIPESVKAKDGNDYKVTAFVEAVGHTVYLHGGVDNVASVQNVHSMSVFYDPSVSFI